MNLMPRSWIAIAPRSLAARAKGVVVSCHRDPAVERTVSIIFVRPALYALAAASVDAAAFARDLGISGATLADSEARLSVAVYYRLWREGPELTADPCFGLH